MIDWGARVDELAFHLATQYRMEDRQALEILLSALIPCPRTAEPWLVAETNWFSRDRAPAWFSFGGTWLPEFLPLLRAMRPHNANQRIAAWLAEPPVPRLFVEPDYDRRLPHYRRNHEISFLLTRTLRLRVISTLDGVTRPADEFHQQTRADRLRALTADVLEDHAGARPSDPPSWNEPRNFLYYTELATRLAGRHPDYGQIASALRALAIRRAFLYGRIETDPSDISLLERALQDYVPLGFIAPSSISPLPRNIRPRPARSPAPCGLSQLTILSAPASTTWDSSLGTSLQRAGAWFRITPAAS